jgi:hypothetical protein
LAISPSTIGSVPGGYFDLWSSPSKWPEKWKGMKATPGATRSVTSALTRALEPPSGPVTQTMLPSAMPRASASCGLISTNMSCCSSASHLLDRVSSPPPSYSTSRPLVSTMGNCSASLFSTAACCSEWPMLGMRNWRAFSSVG